MPDLSDKTILVTRPAGLEQQLMSSLTQAGAIPIHYPAIEICAPGDDSSRDYARQHFADFDIAIFISPTAVKQTLSFMDIDDRNCKLAAIGSRSQKALEQAGKVVSIQPEGHDSESLLQHDAFQSVHVAGKNIVIFRGEDGRDKLGRSLTGRGANIFYAAVYTRKKPVSARPLDESLLASTDAITISSNEGLQNLFEMTDGNATTTAQLLQIPLIVPGARAETLAHQLGFHTIIKASNATDQAMFDALQQIFS